MLRQDKYDKENCIRFNLKLNKKTDKDILDYLQDKNKNGTVKKSIRLLMAQEEENEK